MSTLDKMSPMERKCYFAWRSMRARCTNPNVDSFKNYGGRGIVFTKRWDAFVNFKNDMGLPSSKKYSLNRINNNKGYYPDNCEWATSKTQGRNKRNTIKIRAFGEIKLLKEWSEDDRCNVSYARLYKRIKDGWDIEKAISLKPNQSNEGVKRKCAIYVTINGIEKTIRQWCFTDICSVHYQTVMSRISLQGMNPIKAITMEKM